MAEDRGQGLRDRGLILPLPDVRHRLLTDTQTLAGQGPLTFAEIAAWAQLTQRRLSAWEGHLLHSLSQALWAGFAAEQPPFAPLETRKALLALKLT